MKKILTIVILMVLVSGCNGVRPSSRDNDRIAKALQCKQLYQLDKDYWPDKNIKGVRYYDRLNTCLALEVSTASNDPSYQSATVYDLLEHAPLLHYRESKGSYMDDNGEEIECGGKHYIIEINEGDKQIRKSACDDSYDVLSLKIDKLIEYGF